MKYRIKQVGATFYPQRKRFIRWKNFIDYDKDIVRWEWTALSFISSAPLPVHYNPIISFLTINEAQMFLDEKIQANTVKIFAEVKI